MSNLRATALITAIASLICAIASGVIIAITRDTMPILNVIPTGLLIGAGAGWLTFIGLANRDRMRRIEVALSIKNGHSGITDTGGLRRLKPIDN